MASAPRIRSNSPDTSELGIKTFNPAVSPGNDTAIQIDKKENPSQKVPSSFKGMSEREQVRMLGEVVVVVNHASPKARRDAQLVVSNTTTNRRIIYVCIVCILGRNWRREKL